MGVMATELFDHEIGKFPQLVWSRGQYRAVRFFDVHEHLPEDAIGAPGLPSQGDPYHPDYPQVVCVGIAPDAAPYRHYVRVDYESPASFGFGGNPEPLGTRLTSSSEQLQVRAAANGTPLLEPYAVKVRAGKLILRTQQNSGLWEAAWDLLYSGPFPLVNNTGVALKALEGLNSEQLFNAEPFTLRPDTFDHRPIQPGLLQVDFIFDYGRDLHKITQQRRDQAGNPIPGQTIEFDAYGTVDYTPFLEVVL